MSFIKSLDTSIPFLGFDNIIGIPFSAAIAATDTASARPFVPFTTATLLITSNLFDLLKSFSALAISSAVSSLVSPFILSTVVTPAAFNSSTRASGKTASPPIKTTFLLLF